MLLCIAALWMGGRLFHTLARLLVKVDPSQAATKQVESSQVDSDQIKSSQIKSNQVEPF